MNRVLILIAAATLLISCGEDLKSYKNYQGSTMGTYYKIKSDGPTIDQTEIDALLEAFNQSFSTYIPSSTISQFNQSKDSILIEDSAFTDFFPFAEGIAKLTEGYFDYTVMPLVNAYGFGYKKDKQTNNIDSIMEFIGFDLVHLSKSGYMVKKHENVEIDLSAIAKGYGVDEVSKFLLQKGASNFMIDIGGEVICRGKNDKGEFWKIGIDQPIKNATEREIVQVVELPNKAIATSGNYRNFVESNGVEYVHTVNPKTGEAFQNNILSASVIAGECYMADALATSIMAMGFAKADSFLMNNSYIKAYIIFESEDSVKGAYYNKFEDYLKK